MKKTDTSFLMNSTLGTFFFAPAKSSFTEQEFISDLKERLIFLFYNDNTSQTNDPWKTYDENVPISSLRISVVNMFKFSIKLKIKPVVRLFIIAHSLNRMRLVSIQIMTVLRKIQPTHINFSKKKCVKLN
jgi:CRISPR/Cas system type I-B associated protein Csh2 (Cas7 group RAMP superfamily)